MGCDAKNLIYVMQCKRCDEEYIGVTGERQAIVFVTEWLCTDNKLEIPVLESYM